MRASRNIMGMPVLVEITDKNASKESIEKVFEYFERVDERFSTYKYDSEISRINRGEITKEAYSREMVRVLLLAEETKRATNGYFDIETQGGLLDPSGVVKGWAIHNAALMLQSLGYRNYYVEISGDIQTLGADAEGKPWSIGIRNPFNREEIVKVLYPRGKGVATSGTYTQGGHIYDPTTGAPVNTGLVSLTVLGPNVDEADRFATAAFAMGDNAVRFIESRDGLEAYAIDKNGIATMTSGFESYTTV